MSRAHDGVDQALQQLSKEPDNAWLHVRLASMQLGDHGEWEACLVSLERASRLDATLPLDALRAEALACGGKIEAAEQLFRAHLALHERDAGSWLKLARLLSRQHKTEAALDAYDKALTLAASVEPDHLFEAAQAYATANKLDAALAMIDKAAFTPVLAEQAVQLCARQQRWDEALKRMDALTARLAPKEPWLAKRAALLAQAGRKDEAMESWRALAQRINSLPPAQRQSRAMLRLAEQCRAALADTVTTR